MRAKLLILHLKIQAGQVSVFKFCNFIVCQGVYRKFTCLFISSQLLVSNEFFFGPYADCFRKYFKVSKEELAI